MKGDHQADEGRCPSFVVVFKKSVYHFLKMQSWSLKTTCDYWNPWPINNNYHPCYRAKDNRERRSASEHMAGKSSPQLLTLPTTRSPWQMLSYPKSCPCCFLLDHFLQLSNPELQQAHNSAPSGLGACRWTSVHNRAVLLLPLEGTELWDKTHLPSELRTKECQCSTLLWRKHIC